MPWISTRAKTCKPLTSFPMLLMLIRTHSSAKMNQKHSIMSPFDITSKLLGPYVYSATSRDTLGDKMEYYFQDHSFMPLFVQVGLVSEFEHSRRLDNYIFLPGKLSENDTGKITKSGRARKDLEGPSVDGEGCFIDI